MFDRFIRFTISHPNWKRFITISNDDIVVSYKDYLMSSTSYLKDGATLSHRYWHLINGADVPLCANCCISDCSWNETKKRYNTFCSSGCSAKSQISKNKRRSTLIERFGENVDNIMIEKMQAGTMLKYGVKHAVHNQHIKEKISKTVKDRYGVEHISSSDAVRKKIAYSLLSTYGDEDKKQEILSKTRETNNRKHGADYAILTPKSRERNREVMIEKYGSIGPLFDKSVYEKTISSQKNKRSGKYHFQEHISDVSLLCLNDRNWLYSKHHQEKLTLTEIAEILGVSDVTIFNYFNKHDIQILHFTYSVAEKEIRKIIPPNMVAQYNTRDIINGELDIFIPAKNVAIEYCGLYWHSNKFKHNNAHLQKYMKCKDANIKLITVFENEWNDKKQIVTKTILHKLGLSNERKIYARNTNVIVLDEATKSKFLEANHIQGNCKSSINYALIDVNDDIVAVIAFKKRGSGFELSRYATSCIVTGGFSKLLKYFEQFATPSKIITYSDNRWSDGELYIKNGFIREHDVKPTYYYSNGNGKLYHKSNFRHDNMSKKLKNYDSTKTEEVNMENHGFFKIYDCGKVKFIKNYEWKA